MNKPPILIINSYGGSLTQAAIDEGHPIIASMEDHAFGIDSQMLNFPGLKYVRLSDQWPVDMDLRGSIVIAHPPCSGFSSQNRSRSPDIRGAYSHAFACTTRILDYVLPREPEAVVIESVPGAMEGARPIHDFYAQSYGYNLYRVLQNAASFGVPQWRRRFWAVFVKQRPYRANEFTFKLHHDLKYLGDVLPATVDPGVERDANNELDPSAINRWTKQLRLAKELGYEGDSFTEMLSNTTQHENLIHILATKHGYDKTRGWPPFGKLHDYVVGGNFLSGALHVLDPNSFAPVLLGTAWWWLGNRMLGYADYKEIMGFPRDYQYHKPRLTAVLLSKGVCPPVARWVLQEVGANVFDIPRPRPEVTDAVKYAEMTVQQTVQPGEVANVLTPDQFRTRKIAA
jgi:site-specific DNA-cytosine methylase